MHRTWASVPSWVLGPFELFSLEWLHSPRWLCPDKMSDFTGVHMDISMSRLGSWISPPPSIEYRIFPFHFPLPHHSHLNDKWIEWHQSISWHAHAWKKNLAYRLYFLSQPVLTCFLGLIPRWWLGKSLLIHVFEIDWHLWIFRNFHS